MVMVVSCALRERPTVGHVFVNVTAYRFAHTIASVAVVIDGQQIAVLGVEEEEEAV